MQAGWIIFGTMFFLSIILISIGIWKMKTSDTDHASTTGGPSTTGEGPSTTGEGPSTTGDLDCGGIRVVQWNVQWDGDCTTSPQVFTEKFKSWSDYDFIVTEECSEELEIPSNWNSTYCTSPDKSGESSADHLTIYYNNRWVIDETITCVNTGTGGDDRPAGTATFYNESGLTVRIIGIHLPRADTGAGDNALEALKTLLGGKSSTDITIVLGDFNRDSASSANPSLAAVQSNIEDSLDIKLLTQPDVSTYGEAALDHIFSTKEFSVKVLDSDGMSDHSPLYGCISFS